MRTYRMYAIVMTITTLAWCGLGTATRATDVESFEFNDATGTTLDVAANTAHPGNKWEVDPDMAPSQVAQNVDGRPGSYYILKSASGSDNNFLQIDDITSGKRYLTAMIAGWDFEEAEQEQFRLAFVNGDTEPITSNVITAQMSLVRGTDGTVELTGGALGPGSAPVVSNVTFPAVHTDPFEMTLELDRSANKYKVFYRDANGPSQVLGTGYIDPTRDGKAIRMQATGNYANFVTAFPGTYQIDYVDFFALDRVALADTNPHTDLITLEVDRTNGAMTLRNTSGGTINGIQSYSIESASGGLNPANWTPIAGGTNTSSSSELAQSFGAAINLTNNQAISLSNLSGAWLKSPFEDLTMVLDLTDGVTRTVNVNFINNSGLRWATGDFNFDGSMTVADYTIMATYAETDPTGLSAAEAYRRGDLSGDSLNSLLDFAQFKTIYETANGAGSFAAMLAGVPEPGGLVLLLIAASVGFGSRRLRRSSRIGARIDDLTSYNSVHLPGDRSMPSMRILQRLAVAVSIVATCTSTSQATILEDFSFSEPNGTTLGDAENSANQSNSWSVSANLDNSSVLNGAFRIQKTGTAAAPNYLDIANKTTGKLWLVADIAGWSLNSDTTNLDNFNSAEPEEIRFAFLNNDAPSFGSTLTGQAQFERTSTGGFRLIGNSAGTGSSSVNGTLDLTLDRSDPFTVVLEVDVSDMVDQYSVYYRDGAEGSFASLGTAPASLAPNRDANSARFYVNNSFAGDGEHFDVSRIYVTDTSPLTNVVGLSKLSLIVNTSTRDVQIKNESEEAISFDSYRIASNSDSLSFGEWASLSDRNPPLTPFDGPDGGTTPGDSPGELWTKAGGSDDGVVSESFLLSNTILSPENFLDLGKLFKSGGMQDFVFQYHDADTGALFTIDPTYVTFAGVAGDYNQDGTVNAADYTVWRDHLGQAITLPNEDPSTTPGQVTSEDYTVWKSHFGQSAGGGASATAAVPEPASAIVVAIGALAWVLSTARLRQALVHA